MLSSTCLKRVVSGVCFPRIFPNGNWFITISTNGRKRHIVVDTMGLLLAVVVHSANIHDSKSAPFLFSELKYRFSRLVKIIADGGYRGELVENTKKTFGLILEIVLPKDDSPKFKVLPKRWIVERTFAWFESYRRLSKDFEFKP